MDEGEKPVLYSSQLAVAPAYKRRGLGRFLLGLAEDKAREKEIKLLRLDTAQPAEHLVTLYQSCGFVIVREIQWRGKVYKRYIMEKAPTEIL
jgi:ribosomal protein S18 acetylase RimI-like enzyme